MHKKSTALASRAKILAGVGGVEPPITESKSVALPLGYTPIIENESSPANRIDLCKKMGRVVGVEPTHNGATIRRVNHFTTPATSGIMWDVPHNEMYYTMLFIFSQIFLLSVNFLLPFYIFSLFK